MGFSAAGLFLSVRESRETGKRVCEIRTDLVGAASHPTGSRVAAEARGLDGSPPVLALVWGPGGSSQTALC